MSEIPLKFKHAGKTYEVDVDVSQPGIVLKSQLYSLTGVPPDRQKILVKGGALKDDADLSTLKLKPNQSIMVIGTAGELPTVPVISQTDEKPEISQIVKMPTGLINMGNTCYMNSSVQALRGVPELRSKLKESGISGLASSLANMFSGMDAVKNDDGYSPVAFLMRLRERFPQFAERDGHTGQWKQQDAEELWSQMMFVLKTELPDKEFIDAFFTGRFATERICEETDEEPKLKGVEEFTQLPCHITIKTNFLKQGLIFDETIEKHSDILGRDANFKITKKITRLPKYLAINYVRFFWRRDTNKKSKILRKVAFPFTLDMMDLCEESYAKKLIPARDKLHELSKDVEDFYIQSKRRKKLQGDSVAESAPEEKFPAEKLQEIEKTFDEVIDPEVRADVGASKTGLYELLAVVTHQGSTADSGHYQCWRKSDDNIDEWYKFNDDKVTVVNSEVIERLAGGGESDSALILLYREKEIRG